jgi:DNA helicase HerA-like ATPase
MSVIPGFDIESLNVLGKLIGKLERFHLEGAIPQEFDPQDLLYGSEQTYFCIQGLSSFWNPEASKGSSGGGANFGQYMADLVIASHNQHQSDLTLIILSAPRQTRIYISLGTEKTTRSILEGLFPGIELVAIPIQELTALLRAHFVIKGVITGIPSNKGFGAGIDALSASQHTLNSNVASQQNQDQSQQQVERIIRGMYGATWGYIVQAHPRPRQKVIEERMKVIDLLTQVTNRSRVQWNTTTNDNQQITTDESGGSSKTYSGDVVNYRAQYLIQQLERDLERHDQAMAAGQWTVKTFFGAATMDDTQRLASLLLGTLAGADSRPEPLRATICRRGGLALDGFHTFLNSHEVGTLIRLPREEVPGYAVHDHVHFDVDFKAPDSESLPLGHIQQNGRDTPETYNISINALAKHAVVIGVTGSGKTTTVMNLLDAAVEAKKPFLVIEPAKTEYRAIHSALHPRAELHVYTLGNEIVSPFRMNPFEFETNEEPGSVSLLGHIDFLKNVFNAAFALYPPMPQVLEASLYEVYEDRGWDLTSGTNHRLKNWEERHKYPIFPTMTDLYYKTEEVTNRLGYHSEIESNVKAALKSRIGSLRIGSKGLMLDSARGIPMEKLLTTPTILELENVGNDDEKTFIMGLFLAKLYEYRRLQAATGSLPPGLQHLIVFEEAHRLLKNVNSQVSDEGSNPRAQAIEVFTNMLSEVRAYGQGVVVAEQIPSKLAPDVLKNTNLKIVHRLIAKDDRESIGQTMNLNEEQQNHLGVLTPGMAAVYAEGADHAYKVRLENYKRNITPLVEKALKEMSKKYASVKPFQAISNLEDYDIQMADTGGPEPGVFQAAGKLLDAPKSKWLWGNILLRLVASPTHLFDMLFRFSEHIEAEMSYLPPEQHIELLQMLIVRGTSELLMLRGAQFGWHYPEVEELRHVLTQGLIGFARAYTKARDITSLHVEELETNFLAEMQHSGKYLEQFTNRYQMLMERQQGPFAGCAHCPAKCLYRPEVKSLLTAKNREWISEELSSDSHGAEIERYAAVARAATHIVQSWFGDEPGVSADKSIAGVGYCATLHTIASPDYTEYEQALLGNNLQVHFFKKE